MLKNKQPTQYWYFLCEGTFKASSPEHRDKGVCSSAMVLGTSYSAAKGALVDALDSEGFDLNQITDEAQFSPADIDESDKDNRTWLNWYVEVREHNKPIFTPRQVFDGGPAE